MSIRKQWWSVLWCRCIMRYLTSKKRGGSLCSEMEWLPDLVSEKSKADRVLYTTIYKSKTCGKGYIFRNCFCTDKKLPTQGTWVQSLVRERKSYMSSSAARKQNKTWRQYHWPLESGTDKLGVWDWWEIFFMIYPFIPFKFHMWLYFLFMK